MCPLSSTVVVVPCTELLLLPSERLQRLYRGKWRSPFSSPVMRFARATSESQARSPSPGPEATGPGLGCAWTDFCVRSSVVQLNLPPEVTADLPPATVIYSLRTSAVALPLPLGGIWVMTGGFCEENFPFYLIKCGARPALQSELCLSAFHLSNLRRKLWLC